MESGEQIIPTRGDLDRVSGLRPLRVLESSNKLEIGIFERADAVPVQVWIADEDANVGPVTQYLYTPSTAAARCAGLKCEDRFQRGLAGTDSGPCLCSAASRYCRCYCWSPRSAHSTLRLLPRQVRLAEGHTARRQRRESKLPHQAEVSPSLWSPGPQAREKRLHPRCGEGHRGSADRGA